jgi:threonine synthase
VSSAVRLVCGLCSAATDDLSLARCPDCGEGLEVDYPDFEARVAGLDWPPRPGAGLADRYAPLLPVRDRGGPTLGEGEAPLLRSPRLETELGCGAVYLDYEGANPTGSFKDRGTAVGVSVALSLGARAIGAVSTGNMAASVAAYAARARLPAVILVSHTVPVQKLRAVGVYEPLLLQVERDHGELYFDSLELGRAFGILFLNGDHPFRLEGQKTIALDVCARLHPARPTVVVVPLSSGGNMLAILKGLRELERAGLLARVPKVIGVQPAGCAPIWDAYVHDLPRIRRVERPDTLAGSIRNPFPPSGNRVLAALRGSDADVMTVTDGEMVDAQRRLATEEGLWVQPDSAAAVAALPRLRASRLVGADDLVVCVLTGAGHRDPATPAAEAVAAEPVGFDELPRRLEAFVGALA